MLLPLLQFYFIISCSLYDGDEPPSSHALDQLSTLREVGRTSVVHYISSVVEEKSRFLPLVCLHNDPLC